MTDYGLRMADEVQFANAITVFALAPALTPALTPALAHALAPAPAHLKDRAGSRISGNSGFLGYYFFKTGMKSILRVQKIEELLWSIVKSSLLQACQDYRN